MSIYLSNGFTNRKEYLLDLADNFGIASRDVFALADLLGDTEDFDGLVSTLEDYEFFNPFEE